MHILYYKSDDGLFVTDAKFSKNTKIPINVLINGKKLERTYSENWSLLRDEHEINSVVAILEGINRIDCFILKDKSIESDKIPLKIYKESWNDYENIKSLYEPVYKKDEIEKRKIEFTSEQIAVINGSIKNPSNYTVKYTNGPVYKKDSDSLDILLANLVSYDEIDEILTPEFMIHTKPCTLTSPVLYKIIRKFVLDNIDSAYAEVTSNYDFCFAVSKKAKTKPVRIEKKKNNGQSYSTPRFINKIIEHKYVKVFEMTDTEQRYTDYPILPDMKGESLEDLVNNIKNYLDTLITEINTPISECECCNGTGFIVEKINL